MLVSGVRGPWERQRVQLGIEGGDSTGLRVATPSPWEIGPLSSLGLPPFVAQEEADELLPHSPCSLKAFPTTWSAPKEVWDLQLGKRVFRAVRVMAEKKACTPSHLFIAPRGSAQGSDSYSYVNQNESSHVRLVVAE